MYMLDWPMDSRRKSLRKIARSGAGFPRLRVRASASVAVLAASGVLWLSGAGEVGATPLTPLSLPALLPGTLPNRPGGAGAAWTPPVVKSGSATYDITGNTGTISQSTARAILEWNNFNIARDSTMEFKQPDSSSIALNRVLDPNGNPSQILGTLKANGQVYLINQNGILFGGKDVQGNPGAQVNVGALVASALNITDDKFNNGLFSNREMDKNSPFAWEGDQAGFLKSLVQVENGASLNSANGGFVMLLGPKVENNGAISTPGGQAVLAAGAKVYLAQVPDEVDGVPSAASGYHGFLVEVDPYQKTREVVTVDADGKETRTTVNDGEPNHGSVLNAVNGTISAPRGNVTLVGYAINQEGRISATTSVNQNGIVRLLARDTNFNAKGPNSIGSGGYVAGSNTGNVVLGQGSTIQITPEADTEHTIQDAQKFHSAIVDVVGSNIQMLENSSIKAAGGTVNFSAQSGSEYFGAQAANASRVYLAAGSSIDVSGTQGVKVSAERNVVEVDLRGSVVQDYPLVRDGFLYGKKVWVDIRKGTPLADISGYVAQIGRTVAEKTTEGGTVNIKSEGDIVLRDGSLINFSGGSIDYAGGSVQTTKLISNGKLVDIATASPDAIYSGIAGTYTVDHKKWGVTETFKGMGQWVYSPAYREGKNAGEATFIAKGLTLDGTLLGKATPAPNQREAGKVPLSGKVIIGDSASTSLFGLPDVVFAAQKAKLPADYTPQGESQSGKTVTLSSDSLREGGIGRLAVYSQGKITLPAGVTLDMAPGSGLKTDGTVETSGVTLSASQIDMGGSIHALSGNIALNSIGAINLGANSALTAGGAWINDTPAVTSGTETAPFLIDGGSVTLQAGGNAVLEAGSLIDVSGGAKMDVGGKLRGGNGGSISISSGAMAPGDPNSPTLTLGGELRGYGAGTLASGGKGGTLELAAQSVRIGSARLPSDPVPAGELLLDPAFFQKGGFAKYKVTGQNSLTVATGSEIHPLASRLVLNPNIANRPSGQDIYNFSQPQLLPVDQRLPANIALAASSRVFGNLTLEKGAAIRVDPTGSVSLSSGKQLNVLGSVDAPAGKIALSTSAPGESDDYNPDQSIWIGDSASLSATGYAKYLVNSTGLRQGEVLRGGDVVVNAGKGYVVAEKGSVIDVSGLAPVTLDLLQENGGRKAYAPTAVAGDAGSIAITAREGAFLDGTLAGKSGGGSAAGGSFSLSLLRPLPGRVGTAFKTAPVSIVVQDAGSSIPVGLKAGDIIDNGDADRNGKAFITTQAVKDGEFDSLALKVSGFDNRKGKDADGKDITILESRSNIEFRGDANLAMRRSIMLDAPNLLSTGGGKVNLNAAYVYLGSSDPAIQNAPVASSGGSGTLAINAGLIDLEGVTAWQGFGSANLASASDIRLKGIYNPSNPTDTTLKGGLDSGGDLELKAKQIYPTSYSDFTLAASNPGGTITVKQWAPGQDSPVLSAGGKLTVNAANIEQQGVLKAPFGSIVLNGDSVTLAPGSITSASAEGLTIPFGRTQLSGLEYAYGFNGSDTSKNLSSAPPEKSVQLNGKTVNVKDGATVNLAGGGDLYAYEFVPGKGGSRDMLDPLNAPNTYAILPWLKSAAAYDYQEYQSGAVKSSLKAGDSIYLSAAGGLPAGLYTLMPARYALLEGAYLVKPVIGHRDMLASQSFTQLNGATVVPGYLATTGYDGSLIHDARTSAFEVAPGAIARTHSEYRNTYASDFYAANPDVQMPADAGRLSIAATNALALNGKFLTGAGPGGRGAEVDISSQNIAVGSGSDASAVTLDAATLNNLGAASLLIGGTRSPGSDGVIVSVGASKVTVNSGADLVAPEIILAATDEVTVKAGAKVEGKGVFSGSPKNMTVKNGATGNSYGALLRASSGGQVTIARTGTILDDKKTPINGRLTVEKGASVYADRSLMLDANVDSSVASGSTTLGDHAELGMGSRRISLGDVGGVTEGIAFSNDDLNQFNKLDRLSLTSYSTLDLYGKVALGNDKLKLDIQSAGLSGLQGSQKDAAIQADTLTLSNPSGIVYTSTAGTTPGNGDLNVTANKVVLGKGVVATDGIVQGVSIQGFDNVTLAAAKEIVGSGTGKLDVSGNLVLRSARLTGEAGARQTVKATGDLTYTSPVNPDPAILASLRQVNALGAHFDLRGGDKVTLDGVIDLRAGGLTASAAHDVTLTGNAQINAAGAAVKFIDTVAYAPGGSVALTSDGGNVNINPGAVVDVSGADGGDAGTLAIRAVAGTANLDGTLKGYADKQEGSTGKQGSFSLDVATLASFSDLNGKLAAKTDSATGKTVEGGFAEAVDVRVRSGDLSVASTDTVKAHQFTLAADSGKIDVAGKIDATGDKGGSIGLYASGDVTLKDGAMLDAHATLPGTDTAGTTGSGGKVTLATKSGAVDIQKNTSIDVSGAGTGMGGSVLLRAPRNAGGTDVNVTRIAGAIKGAKEVVVEGFKTYDKTSIASADVAASSGNQIYQDASSFMGKADAIRNRIDKVEGGTANLHIRPGVEVDSSGDLALDALWDLYKWRFNNEPGVLTLRAAGDLNINKSLSDGFNVSGISGNKNFTLATLADTRSWSYRLAAGADLNAANPLAVKPLAQQQDGKGSLKVAPGIGYKSATTTTPADYVAKTLTAIRTGTGNIDISAGRDVVLGNAESVIYTAGRPDNLASDFYPYTLYGTNSSGYAAYYPKQGGNLAIRAQGNVEGAVSGVTTTGAATPMQMVSDWMYRRGKVDANGNILGSNTSGFNNLSTTWLIYFPRFEQNIGALGGGDVSVVADGSINNLSVVIPTNAWLSGNAGTPSLPSNLHVNGGGDLTVRAGQDIAGGLFYVSQGKGTMSAGNSLAAGTHQVNIASSGTADMQDIHPILALDRGSFQVQAGSDLNLEAAVNATVVGQAFSNSRGKLTSNSIDTAAALTDFYTYASDSSISLSATSGNIHLFNDSNKVIEAAAPQLYAGSSTYGKASGNKDALSIYPPNLRAAALQGDVMVGGSPTLFPSASGSLELLAQGSVSVDGTLRLSDSNPAWLSTAIKPAGKAAIPNGNFSPSGFSTLLHQDDNNPIRLYALTGDITGGKAYFPKQARLLAGQDIVDFDLQGQNLRDSDVTGLTAGRDIKFTTGFDDFGNPVFASDRGLTLGGPGRMEVVAGRNVDLGGSNGIVTRGNIDNPSLPGAGANIAVSAGMTGEAAYSQFVQKYFSADERKQVADYVRSTLKLPDLDDAAALAVFGDASKFPYGQGSTAPAVSYAQEVRKMFFDKLKQAGQDHNQGGDYERGYQAIATLFPGGDYKGDINLFFSQIKTEHGGNIELMAPGGLVNAGLANPAFKVVPNKSQGTYTIEPLKTANQLGIVTVDGGSIRSFTHGDFLVNQSRVFTLGGGDILLWSSEGNIDAGKGSKTASAAPPPQIKVDPNTGAITVDTTNAVSGSGIGVLLAKDGISPGSTDLIAPKGEVNAGDAGIRAAGNLNIAALRVVGAENIQFGGAATGVPTANAGSLGAGLSGIGNTSDAATAAGDATKSLASNAEKMEKIKQAMADFKPSIVTVEVIGLGE